MKTMNALVLTGMTFLTLAAAPSRSFAQEIPIPGKSCHSAYERNRKDRLIFAGVLTAVDGLTVVAPLFIIADAVFLPMYIHNWKRILKYGSVIKLTEEVYRGEGGLYDEMVADIQKQRPEITRDQIRNAFMLEDSKLTFCPEKEQEEHHWWRFKGLYDIDNGKRPYHHYDEVVGDVLKALSEQPALSEPLMGAVGVSQDVAAIETGGTPSDNRIESPQGVTVSDGPKSPVESLSAGN